MSDATADKIAKLPKWAQDHIKAAERREARLLERLAEWERPAEGATVTCHAANDFTKQVALPDTAVRMAFGDGPEAVRIRRIDGGRIEVSGYGAHGLSIRPRSSNSFWLENRDD